MLKKLFDESTCAECKNCCIFEEGSAWELPTFSKAAAARLAEHPEYAPVQNGERVRLTLPYDASHAAQPCPFLDAHTGCTLPPEEKPFACSLWPVRVMRNADGSTVLTLYRGCPGLGAEQLLSLRHLLDSGLMQRIRDEVQSDPTLILPYHKSYIPICPLDDGSGAESVKYPEPQAVFRYFAELAAIPHGSGNTAQIRAWCLETAARLHLSAESDDAGNVIIRKAASAGFENRPHVILQGHMDMVCAKLPSCGKNMEKQGLDLIWGEEFLSADGTTLGGDDGIALAYAFALLENDSIPHPPLTVIFTVDEETGMDGASALSPDALAGTCLINLDSEEEGVFTVGCAGGVRVHADSSVQREECRGTRLTLMLSGLTGGHSGSDIDKHRLNADVAAARMLRAVSVPLRLSAFAGGVRDNVIPSECTAEIIVTPCMLETVLGEISREQERLAAEYPEEQLRLEISPPVPAAAQAVTPDDSRRLLDAILSIPSDVIAMDDTLHMPELSMNLGTAVLSQDGLHLDILIRSSVNEKKRRSADQLCDTLKHFGFETARSGDYPAWEYTGQTALERTASAVFAEMYGKAPVVQTIHAGLECGILSAKNPALQCISIGPDIYDIHTPRERLPYASVQRTWELLLRLLRAL